ncbi:MAG: 4-hydroxythreonine-4-phosphate dehydrogenase PdxA [Shimia sp.]
MTRPIALSCGEPAGIGPEIAQKAWDALRTDLPFLWIGDPRHLPLDLPWRALDDPSEAPGIASNAMPVLPVDFATPATLGHPTLANAAGVVTAIERAVALAQAGHVRAICTAPIHKKVLQDGCGFSHPGHTEFLSALAKNAPVVMMLASPLLRVVPATIHIPLAEVPTALTPALLRETVAITLAGLRRDFGIPAPRLAIAGLNPHAGEGGKIGREEVEWLTPLIAELAAEHSAQITGPHPADTLFHAAARTGYDAAICMYHDQALIPIKALDFDRGVNVTLGLPFIRTSPDHGTALDIADQRIARPDSLIAALQMAADMADRTGR